MKKISEDTKITLTIGQLRRLVKESASDNGDFEIKDGVLVKYHGNEQDVVIPDGVKSIGDKAFNGYRNMKSVTIPDSVTSIEYAAFCGCEGLKSIEIPNSVKNIGVHAFAGCQFDSITIPNSVTSIGNHAFFWCDKLSSVVLPNSVTNIGYQAFNRCRKLETIVVSNEKQKEMLLNGENEFSYSVEIKTKEEYDQDKLVDEMVKRKVYEMAEYAQEVIGDKYLVKVKTGRRGLDPSNKHYTAIVIYGGQKRDIDQLGYIIIRHNKSGDSLSYEVQNRFPEKLDLNDWKADIKELALDIVS